MASIPEVIASFKQVELPSGQKVFTQGQSCQHYTVLTEGSVKVYARSSEGREVILYRIKPGEICVLTTSCLMGKTNYPAEAVTETAIKARILSHQQFDQLLAESETFRTFIFNSFSQRLTDLMLQLENIALTPLDKRIHRFLLQHASNNHIKATHQQIATELGTAREVVSRNLKALEKQNIIKLHRGSIEIIDISEISK